MNFRQLRAWDKQKNKWVYSGGTPSMMRSFWKWVMYDVDTPINEQTTLKDANGVDIYQGDILEYLDGEYSYAAVVMWDDETGRYYMMGTDVNDNFSFDDIDASEHKVIGNIYENPELK